ncbi:MAG TPA: hypothetical protein VGL66_02680 [Caulobacteraceae bacterium]|jgi:hypothetical protein
MSGKNDELTLNQERPGRVLFSDPSQDLVFRLTPGVDAMRQVKELEQAFCMAEQRLGTLRAG